jgi:hypothetical protein
MSKAILVVLFAVLIVALVLLGPLVTIWAFNTLFGKLYLIPYAFDTWLAVLVMGAFLKGSVTYKK